MKPFACLECPYSSVKEEHLKNHHISKHYMPYHCALCQFKCKSGVTLQRHQTREHPEFKPYKCRFPNCPFTTAHPMALKGHWRSHAKDKKFKCTKCRLSFARKYLLEEHVLTHIPKKIECPICKKKFVKLTTHMKVHNK